MLASGQENVSADRILNVLREREQLASTGVGGGVAVPHGSVDELGKQVGALLVCPTPIDFEAIDDRAGDHPVRARRPEGAPAEHLKISRACRACCAKSRFAAQLAGAKAGAEAYS